MIEDQYCSIQTQESWDKELAEWEAKKKAAQEEREAKILEMKWILMQIEIKERYIEWLDWVIGILKTKREQELEDCRDKVK